MLSSNTTQVSDGGYQISRSLRFNSADSAYLNRTPASAGNRRTWTWSGWVKRSNLATGLIQGLFEANDPTSTMIVAGIRIETNNTIKILDYSGTFTTEIQTTQLFRDVSAWYHIVVAYDTTQTTASNRVKIYVNGVQITSFSITSYPILNFQGYINTTGGHYLGACIFSTVIEFLDGYMTEVNFIDGQALTPSSFGETNAQTGVWQPKAYSGSYGTNGFYLNFSDNSNTTSTTLGKDYSGNGNNWTPNGFLVSAGPNNDSLVDSPTSYGVDTGVGGTVRGNYATLNPLSKSSSITLANGNLDASTAGGGAWGSAVSTLGLSSGKWYFEATWASGVANPMVGYTSSSADINTYLGGVSGSAAYFGNGSAYINGSPSPYGASYTTGDVIGVAIDMDAGTIVCYKNNTTQGTLVSGLTGTIFVGVSSTNGTAMTVNMGQRPFAYTAPSGFKALCTQNLPTPTIGATTATQAGKFFDTSLYTGNAGALTVTNSGFQPDWLWIKRRDASGPYHNVFDSVRGVNKILFPNVTDAEYTSAAYLTSFNSGGFTLGAGDTGTNANAALYVGWQWKANGSGSSNTAGSITSTVSANTTSGFSIVTYTGTGANATVGHGIGSAPKMVIYKARNTTGGWFTYHTSVGPTKELELNTTNGEYPIDLWQNTNPSSTVFYLSNNIYVNNSGTTYVAYCFAPIAGYSAFGSFTGNGSADGAFVFTGMRPAFVMLKASSTGGAGYNWGIFDNDRLGYNSAQRDLRANTTDTEGTDNNLIDFLSNGFKIRSTSGGFGGGSGVTYIYMAFAENPFKYSLAR